MPACTDFFFHSILQDSDKFSLFICTKPQAQTFVIFCPSRFTPPHTLFSPFYQIVLCFSNSLTLPSVLPAPTKILLSSFPARRQINKPHDEEPSSVSGTLCCSLPLCQLWYRSSQASSLSHYLLITCSITVIHRFRLTRFHVFPVESNESTESNEGD